MDRHLPADGAVLRLRRALPAPSHPVSSLVGAFQSTTGRQSLENISTVFAGPRYLDGVRPLDPAVVRRPPSSAPSSAACSPGRCRPADRAAAAPDRHRGVRRPGPVRRRDARVRVPRHVRLHRPRDRCCSRRPSGGRPERRKHVALRDDRADGRLHLLPDPAHGHRLPAGPRRAAPGVVGGVDQPGWLELVVLAPRRRTDPRAELPGRALLLCSPTRSRRTPPPPRWSARAARSCRSRSREAMSGEVDPRPGERGQGPGPRDDHRRRPS